ncbi:MAG: 1,4-alpha-glucan branching protein [Acidobacteria bacterium]|nr:MAG: 1,4-alpha-glucan branching protein [Acidobacteriota bacterium]
MGATLHDGGCTFRVWAPHADAVAVKVWPAAAPVTAVLARDTAEGYGNACWSAFVPGVVAGTDYRYVVTDGARTTEHVDPVALSVVYPNWSPATRDDSDARGVVTGQAFVWASPFQAPGWRELVIYQLHVGTFAMGVPGGATTVSHLIGQLPYLQDLGVNAIQILPFTEFGSALSLGYNSVLPYAVERDYGTPDDVKRLVDAAHAHGLAVLVDVVYNHVNVDDGGRLLPYSLFAFDGWAPASNPCGIFFYGGDEMATPWGAPRPDYGRPEVRRWLRDNALLWLEEYRADGLRFDSTKCIRRRQGPCGDQCCGGDIGVGRNYGWELMQEITDAVEARQPWKITIAEDLDGDAALTARTSAGGAGFDAQWDASLGGAVRAALTQPDAAKVDLDAVAQAITGPLGSDPFARVIYVESHDEAKARRLPDAIAPGDAEGWHARKKSMLAAGVVFTAPGIPMLFQGYELLDWRPWSDVVPMDWSRAGRFAGHRRFHRDLIRARTNADGRTRGLCGSSVSVIGANPDTKVLAYHRWDQGAGADDVVVIANFSGTTFPSYQVGLPYPGTWYVRINSDASVYSDAGDFAATHCFDCVADLVAWDARPWSAAFGLGPYALVVLSR